MTIKKGNPALKFIPLLILYLGLIGFMYESDWQGDERRFLYYAENISQGFYADAENPEFRNGPGYPMFLSLFVLLGLPHIVVVLVNPLLILGGLYFFYRTLRYYLPEKLAFYLTYFMGLYPVMLLVISLAVYEAYYFFLVCAFFYFFLGAFQKYGLAYRDFIVAGVFLGILALTRFVYGYSVFFSLPLLLLALVFKRTHKLKGMAITLGMAAMLCLPYLSYTYSLSGKLFYWGTNGGEVLYWMTSGEENEVGDWQSRDEVLKDEIEGLHPKHKEFYQTLIPLNHFERDAALKAKARENIEAHPEVYVKNWVNNLSRLFFGFPKSFRQQDLRPLPYIFWHFVIILALGISLVPAIVNRKKIPTELLAIWVIYLLYLGFTSIVHAVPRYLVSVMPFWVLWIGYIYHSFTDIRLNTKRI